jgi:hypothetical protein
MLNAKNRLMAEKMIPELKKTICQILSEKPTNWLYPRDIAEELDRRLSGPLFKRTFWGKLILLLRYDVDMRRERALSDAYKELIKEGKIKLGLGAYKIIEA